MKPLLRSLKDLLLEQKIGTEETIWLNAFANKQDCIALFEYKGYSPITAQTSGRNVQFNVKMASYKSAESTCLSIYHFLADAVEEAEGTLTRPDGRFMLVSLKQMPFLSARAEDGYCTFTFNAIVTTQRD